MPSLSQVLARPRKGIAAIAAEVAACSGADLAADNLTADVVLGAIGIQRRRGLVEHHQQFGLVGMQPREQAVEGGEAGATVEDAIEARPQREAAAFLCCAVRL